MYYIYLQNKKLVRKKVSNYLHWCLVKFPYLQENKANVFSIFMSL